MGKEVVINTLVENTVNIPGLRGEHGISFLIRVQGRKVLFDTGQSDLIINNAEQMGLGLDDVSAIVVSHGHFDHTGGLVAAMEAAPAARIFLHGKAVEPKFSQQADGRVRYIGMSAEAISAVARAGDQVDWISSYREIIPGLYSTGPVPRQTEYEDSGGRFYLDEACANPDLLEDEQSLYVDTPKGLVVVLGCGHPGLINTLLHVRKLTNGRPIHTVMGGFHLLSASRNRLDLTMEALREMNVQRLIPAHCTGAMPTAQIWQAFPRGCAACPVGTNLTF